MRVTVTPLPLSGTIDAIPSKSYAHRYLICAALADGRSVIECGRFSDDILATVRCISALGASVDCLPGRFAVYPPANGGLRATAEFDCGESGSTLRFLAPVVSAVGGGTFRMSGRLADRPMDALNKALAEHGATVDKRGNSLVYGGKMTGGEFRIPGDVSSQFISGLLMALPLVGGERVKVTTPLSSAPYVDITADAMSRFGVRVRRGDCFFEVSPDAHYKKADLAVPGDWSNAAFWLASGVKVAGLDPDDAQGDRAILDILSRMGADVRTDADGIEAVFPDGSNGIELDAENIPDLAPVAAVLAARAKGVTRIYNAARLREKESDRISSISAMLTAFGTEHSVTGDGLVIYGRGGRLKGGCTVDSLNDHRIVMAAAVGAVYADGPVVIDGAEAVAKSYPCFWDDYKKLGGKIDVQYAGR